MHSIDSLIKIYPSLVDESLKQSYINKQDSIKETRGDSIRVTELNVISNVENKRNKKAIENIVEGKLGLKTPCTVSLKDFETKINKVYGSKYFQEVRTQFEKGDSSYILNVRVKEQTKNSFQVGGRFDQTYGVNVLLRGEFRNLLLYGSLLELGFIIGQSPQLKLRYTTDRGKNIGGGSSIVYDYFDAYSYENDKIFSSYGYRRLDGDLFLHTYAGNFNRFILGTSATLFTLSAYQSSTNIRDLDQFFYSAYFAYIVDTWDDAYYPKKGFKAKLKVNLRGGQNSSFYTQAWLRASQVIPITKKIKVIADGFIGFGSIGSDTTLYRYQIGGMENNRIEWYNSFPGLRFLEDGANNIWIAKISPRYEFYKNNYLTYTFAVAAMDWDFFNMFYEADRFYSGMSLKYGFDSMFGPLEISVDYSIQSKRSHYFISLGFWF
jgi:NTE family protein